MTVRTHAPRWSTETRWAEERKLMLRNHDTEATSISKGRLV